MASGSDISFDEKRNKQIAYEYLCHLEESKLWLEHILKTPLPASSDLETYLRNGVVLAQVANFCCPDTIPVKKIFDLDFKRYNEKGLHFKHTDNINTFFKGMNAIGLPKVFLPETTDIYDMKNMPKLIYCLHALSLYLFKLGRAPQIQDLLGKVQFSEEEIVRMQTTLQQYGIQMPIFSKIGGILAGELSENEAALHAAIMLINDAISVGDQALLLERLKNPSAQLQRIRDYNVNQYIAVLRKAKDNKVLRTSEKKKELNQEEVDVYDEILTQAEIQGHINTTNVVTILAKLNDALRQGSDQDIAYCILSEDIGNLPTISDNKDEYVKELKRYYMSKKSAAEATSNNGDVTVELNLSEIEKIVMDCNFTRSLELAAERFVQSLNQALKTRDSSQVIQTLDALPSHYPRIEKIKGNLYCESMMQVFDKNGGGPLDTSTVLQQLKVLEVVCAINRCIDLKSSDDLCRHLAYPDLSIRDVDEDASSSYLEDLISAKKHKETKLSQGLECSDLLATEITATIDLTNKRMKEQNDLVAILTNVNAVIKIVSAQDLLKLLSSEAAKLYNVNPENAEAYLGALRAAKIAAEELHRDPDASLWHEEIQEIVNECNQNLQRAQALSAVMKRINEQFLPHHTHSLDDIINNPLKLKTIIQSLEEGYILGIITECGAAYATSFSESLKKRSQQGWNGWVRHCLSGKGNTRFFVNYHTGQYLWWSEPSDYKPGEGYLNNEELQELCNRVGADYNREMYFKSNNDSIVLLQKWHQAYIARKAFLAHLSFVKHKLPHLLVLQAYIRCVRVRQPYVKDLKFFSSFESEALLVKAFCTTAWKRYIYLRKINYFRQYLDDIIALQSLIRSCLAHNDYNNLVHQQRPQLKVVCKYLNLLEFDANDLLEERELSRLRGQVLDRIKEVFDLEQELKDLDIRIGLLVKNKINIQDFVGASKQSNKRAKGVEYSPTITKEKLALREKYGHLFYILQAYPTYMSKLVLQMSVTRSNKLVRDIFFLCFNYGANFRDEFLILRTFRTAIEYEVATGIESIDQFSRNDPVIIRLAIGLWRDIKVPTFLQQMLSSVVTDVLSKRYVINTNPVEVYKQWLSQMETETGQPSTLPYDVDVEKALEQAEVRNRLQTAISTLVSLTVMFRQAIVSAVNIIPYGIRFFAKTLFEALRVKFPNAEVKELYKVLANFLYYRFINPVIVSPDGFGIVPLDKNEITSEQRKSLATISAVLQNAAANKLYEGESTYLMPLNACVQESAAEFHVFYAKCMDIEPLEQHFNMDEYTDQASLQKPELKLTCGQILEVHKLLNEYTDVLCPSENDVLYNAMKAIGDVPKPSDLVDRHPKTDTTTATTPNTPVSAEHEDEMLSNAFVVLSLIPPKEVHETEDAKMKTLFSDTIKMIVDLLHFYTTDSLSDLLRYKFSSEQEHDYNQLLAKRAAVFQTHQEGTAADGTDNHNQASLPPVTTDSEAAADKDTQPSEPVATLKVLQATVLENLKVLETAGLVSSTDDYNACVLAITKDVRDRTQYRRRQRLELIRLRGTLNNLNDKKKYFVSQSDSYNQYVKACIENMDKGKKGKGGSSSKSRVVVKQNASKLLHSGVVLEIDGLTSSHLKDVVFEISSTDDPGVFHVSAKLFGVKMESIDLVIQDLLQMQYEGVSVIKMFDRAKINVNLLIHFINKKFYSKK